MPLPDFWLARGARAGDKAAFGALYDRHGPRVYNLLRRMCADASLAEDLTQETFLAAYRSLAVWRGRGAFGSWLCGIAVRLYRNSRRSQSLDQEELDETVAAGADCDPLAACTAAEARSLLDRALLELPDSCLEAFVLVYIESFSYKETATLLDVPVGTVQSRLNRAKRLLQVKLSSWVGDEAAKPDGVKSHVT
jgi:RNA polymerase sigma-70 factor (ECF subfamily)